MATSPIDAISPPAAAPRPGVERAPLPPTGSPSTAATDGRGTPESGELIEPVQRINEVMRSYGVQFDLAEHDSRIVTRIVDRETGEVIRQIPPEEMLRIAERLEEVQGRLIDLRA